jgi:peptidyl-prolyl cis-trans isomerase A (cyclophilin A)
LVLVPVLVACDAPAPEPTQPSAKKEPAGPSGGGATTAAASGQGGADKPKAKGPFPESTHAAMKDPSLAKEQAPEKFTVKFDTTAGEFNVECTREWAPNGVDRFYSLVKIGFFDDVSLFRAVKGFVVQFGIHGNPEVSAKWRDAQLPKDEVKGTNSRGMLTYAMAGSPDTRTTQLFFNLNDNARLDGMGFSPICKVNDDGMSVVDKIYMGYGERPSKAQGTIQTQGNKYLRETYPELDYIKTVRLVGDDTAGAGSASASASAGAAPSASAAASASAKAAPSAKPSAGPAPKKPQ